MAAVLAAGKGDGSYTVSGEGLVCTLLAGPGGAELAAEGGKALLQQALEGKKDAVVAEVGAGSRPDARLRMDVHVCP